MAKSRTLTEVAADVEVMLKAKMHSSHNFVKVGDIWHTDNRVNICFCGETVLLREYLTFVEGGTMVAVNVVDRQFMGICRKCGNIFVNDYPHLMLNQKHMKDLAKPKSLETNYVEL